MKKRLMALTLALLMVFALVPMANADEIPVAMISDTKYTSVAAAVAAVKDGETVEVIEATNDGLSGIDGKTFTFVAFDGTKYSIEKGIILADAKTINAANILAEGLLALPADAEGLTCTLVNSKDAQTVLGSRAKAIKDETTKKAIVAKIDALSSFEGTAAEFYAACFELGVAIETILTEQAREQAKIAVIEAALKYVDPVKCQISGFKSAEEAKAMFDYAYEQKLVSFGIKERVYFALTDLDSWYGSITEIAPNAIQKKYIEEIDVLHSLEQNAVPTYRFAKGIFGAILNGMQKQNDATTTLVSRIVDMVVSFIAYVVNLFKK